MQRKLLASKEVIVFGQMNDASSRLSSFHPFRLND